MYMLNAITNYDKQVECQRLNGEQGGMRYKLVDLGKGVTVVEQVQELGDDLHTQKRASIVGHQYTALDYLRDPITEV
jgi:hypothetical protein